MSFEEFLAWDGGPDETKHFEWVDGEAVEMVSVTSRHDSIVRFLSSLLGIIGENGDIGVAHGEPFLMRLAGVARSPDVLFVRTENRERIRNLYLDGPADIVAEVVSPGSIKIDYHVKREEYKRAGVPEYWIIDPINRESTFLTLDDEDNYRESELNEDGLYVSKALNGLTIDPEWFRQEPLPKIATLSRKLNLL
jgi:Uma2 family endonuclease